MTWSSVLVYFVFCGTWSLINGLEGDHLLLYSDFDKIDLVDLGTHENSTITDGLRASLSFDYHSDNRLVVVADTYSSISVVGTGHFLGSKETIVRTQVGQALGLAVDWINDHVYWTDETFQNVQVSTLDGTIRRSLIEFWIDKPRGIAIDPHKGILFFADYGSTPRIERCGLDGEDREVIILDVSLPNGLAIDHKAQRIYWADGSRNEIKSANFDGRGIKTVIKNSRYLPAPFGIDVYHDKVYWTNLEKSDIFRTEKYASYEVEKIYMGTYPTGIKFMNDIVQKNFGKTVCGRSNGGCSDLCLPAAPWSDNDYTCVCRDGHTLSLDGRSCYYSGRNIQLLLAEKNSISTTDLDSLEMVNRISGEDIVGVDYHYKQNLMYVSDKRLHNIFVTTLSKRTSGLKMKPLLPTETFNPGNVAVDWVYDHLYWMETLFGHVHVCELDGRHMKTLIRDLSNPSGLALYPEEGLMFFSEWSYRTGGRITRSSMDGSNKKNILVDKVEMPLGIAIDYLARRIYWTDASLNEIKSATFEGEDTHSVIQYKSDSQPFGIAVYDKTLWWSNSASNNVYSAHKYTGENVRPFVTELKTPRHLKIAAPNSQKKGSNKCFLNKNKCEHLCLPVPLSESEKGFSCACADGFHTIEETYCVIKESAKLVKEEL